MGQYSEMVCSGYIRIPDKGSMPRNYGFDPGMVLNRLVLRVYISIPCKDPSRVALMQNPMSALDIALLSTILTLAQMKVTLA